MLSNYVWNEALSNFLRAGEGDQPEHPDRDGRAEHLARARTPARVPRQAPAARRLCAGRRRLPRAPHRAHVHGRRQVDQASRRRSGLPSAMFRNPEGQAAIDETKPRHKEVEDIPSPWLTGIQDEFFDGKLAPMIETNRGCPFTCTFCVQGTKWYTKVHNFPWIASRRRSTTSRGASRAIRRTWARCASPTRTTACSSATSRSPATSGRCRATTAGRRSSTRPPARTGRSASSSRSRRSAARWCSTRRCSRSTRRCCATSSARTSSSRPTRRSRSTCAGAACARCRT